MLGIWNMPKNFDEETGRLKKAIDELTALNRIANAINALMSVEKITQVIVDHCLKRVNAKQGAVFLLEEEDRQVDKFKTFIREFSADEQVPFHINESLTGWMIKNKTMFVINDPNSDARFKNMQLSRLGIDSILSAPLMSQSGLIGSLTLFNKKDAGGFTNDDKRFLGIVGSQVAKVIENARLREKEQELIAMQEEMNLARAIQRGFLPKSGLSLPPCEVYGFNLPAKEVGGDFYDILKLNDEQIFFSIGDVSGKGVPAALLMANAQAILRSQLIEAEEAPMPKLAKRLNQLICQCSSPEQFITILFGRYNSAGNVFEYINAGHEPPMVIRKNGEIEIPQNGDLIIGVTPEYNYTENRVSLGNGDMLFACTDGVTETFNDSDEEFGCERLKNLLKECHNCSPDVMRQKIMDTLSNYRGPNPQPDDITMVILKVN